VYLYLLLSSTFNSSTAQRWGIDKDIVPAGPSTPGPNNYIHYSSVVD